MVIFRLSLWVMLCIAANSVLAFRAASAGNPPNFPPELKNCGTGRSEQAISGDKLQLGSGEIVALAEIKAPEFWPRGAPYKSWPHGAKAKTALSNAAAGVELNFYCYNKRKNALGERVVHILTGNGAWLQRVLLKEGHAYFMPHHHKALMADSLRAAETEARDKRRGLWSITGMAAVSANSDKLRPGWFQLVVGTVVSEKRLRGKTYLNFGEDWSRDFTVEIPKRLYAGFPTADENSLNLQGQIIEVRGWTEWAGGPKIIMEHAQQLIVRPGTGKLQ